MKRRKLIAAVVMTSVVLIVSLGLAVTPSDWLAHQPQWEDICVHEAYAMITYKMYPNMVILDVRTPDEYHGITSAGHIAGAINIPWDQLDAYFNNGTCPLIGSELNLTIVYCGMGGRSARACDILQTHGFKLVRNMIGGINEWLNPAWNYPLAPPYNVVTATEAYNMIIGGSCKIIVDVLEPETFNTEHIVNSTDPPFLHAINIPYYNDADFATRLGKSILPGNKDENIIVYCASSVCTKGPAACNYLVTHGYTKIYLIENGILAWKGAGKPTYPPTTWILVDSYGEINLGGSSYTLKEQHPSTIVMHSGVAQSFASGSSQHLLMAIKVYLRKVGSPAGTLTARLYAHSGTYGTSSIPVEASMIEESTTSWDISTGLTASYTLYAFDFAGTTQMTADTHYCIAIMVKSKTLLNDSNYVYVGVDSTTPTHSGNCALYESNKWIVSHLVSDMIFYVYGK